MTLLLPGAARLKYENVGKHEINDRNPGQPGQGRGGTRRDTQSDTSASITLHTAQRELVYNWEHVIVKLRQGSGKEGQGRARDGP